MTRTVVLEPLDPPPNVEAGRRPVVAIERETAQCWFGRPAANGACPTLAYPKWAWRLSDAKRELL